MKLFLNLLIEERRYDIIVTVLIPGKEPQEFSGFSELEDWIKKEMKLPEYKI